MGSIIQGKNLHNNACCLFRVLAKSSAEYLIHSSFVLKVILEKPFPFIALENRIRNFISDSVKLGQVILEVFQFTPDLNNNAN